MHPVVAGDNVLRAAVGSNGEHLLVGQFGCGRFCARRPAPLLHHIRGVVCRRAKKKVVGAHARRRVARVANAHVARRLVCEPPSGAVCQLATPFGIHELTIAEGGFSRQPKPAAVRLLYFPPKPFGFVASGCSGAGKPRTTRRTKASFGPTAATAGVHRKRFFAFGANLSIHQRRLRAYPDIIHTVGG